jgi:VWFA-related protein
MLMSAVAAGLGLCALTATTGARATASAPRQAIRSVQVSVTEKDGRPVTNLTAADFEVKENGQATQVIGAEITKTPVRMAMIVSDGGTGGFQQSMAGLLQKLQLSGEFSLISVLEQSERIVDYTSDLEALVTGIQRMGSRTGRPTSSGPVMEAIWEALKTVHQPGKRPVIVVMRMGGSASSSVRADVVREAIRKTGTRLYVLAPTGAGGASAAGGGGGGAGNMGVARAGYADSESARRGLELEIVLNDGSKESGGRYETISNATQLKVAEQIADELLAQYQVSYRLPDAAAPGDRIEVTTRRSNLRVYAPTRIAN